MNAKDIIIMINQAEDLNVKKGMLKIYNAILQTDFTLLAGRVVKRDDDGKLHDVYAWLEIETA